MNSIALEETCLDNINLDGHHDYECEKCGHRYRTETYREMTSITNGALEYCSSCGRKITGYKIDGVPLKQVDEQKYRWAKGLPPRVFGRVLGE